MFEAVSHLLIGLAIIGLLWFGPTRHLLIAGLFCWACGWAFMAMIRAIVGR